MIQSNAVQVNSLHPHIFFLLKMWNNPTNDVHNDGRPGLALHCGAEDTADGKYGARLNVLVTQHGQTMDPSHHVYQCSVSLTLHFIKAGNKTIIGCSRAALGQEVNVDWLNRFGSWFRGKE